MQKPGTVGHGRTKENRIGYYSEIRSLGISLHGVFDEQVPYW